MNGSLIVKVGVAVIIAATLTSRPRAAEVADEVAAECGICHQMRGPASSDLSARQARKGPPLFFAGDKFRKDWLEAWLQKPTRIRPAGDYPPAHAIKTAKADDVDAASLPGHPALSADKARVVAAYLMLLRPNRTLLAREAYTPGRISERLGAMSFVKFQGCAACHKDTAQYGGVSGPELYTAWQRLDPAFIVSYIRDPMAWEPRSMMPNKHLNTPVIHKLADYLRAIGTKTGKAQ